MSSSSVTKTCMWQTDDDVLTCDVADDIDVPFHMLSHIDRGTKIKKTKLIEGPNPKIHKK